MFRTPKKPTGRFQQRPAKGAAPMGLFQDGIWACDCNPRMNAAYFLTKKDGPNAGKWFYTCQEPEEKSCGFFLWEDAAVRREKQAILNNTRSEIDANRPPAETARDGAAERHSAPSSQVVLDVTASDEEDEFGDFPLTPAEMVTVFKSAEKASASNITPSNPESMRKTPEREAFATPTKRKRDEEELPTPATGGSKSKRMICTSPDGLNGGMWDGNKPFGGGGGQAPVITPTPNRSRKATDIAVSQDSKVGDYDITDEIMGALRGQSIDETTSTAIRDILNRYSLKISGIIKGRDITRMALKSKDTKIAELSQKITALETEKEMDKVVIRHCRNETARTAAAKRAKKS
ncbi:hypothetical protein BJ875DRAFT_485254 [Amylocarpus encephaloides]|uniref:GRF-type domain-containing protein n=1 Tax=Amylocarpus encephaloides TaxID=45428 RepID=A0A9P7YGY2_9HELO|nr:hypothetical protein BJ875DRAFT_485254 [Amylocarpus encephaloides]